MKSTYLGRSCRSLPAACRRRGAGSTTSQRLKEHRSRERPKLLTSGLKLACTAAARVLSLQGPEERRGRVRERYVPWRKTGRADFFNQTP